MERGGIIDKQWKANKVLINQKIYKYPIYYFQEEGDKWRLLGIFSVSAEKEKYVELCKFEGTIPTPKLTQENIGKIYPIDDGKELTSAQVSYLIEKLTKIIKEKENKTEEKPIIQKKIKPIPKNAPISIVSVSRLPAIEKGSYKFKNSNGTIILAKEDGMINNNPPYTGRSVTMKIYEKDESNITVWEWQN